MIGLPMRVLVHLGLNKCASTFVQNALSSAAPVLRAHGVSYPGQGRHGCQYGLSRHYGFGPESAEVEGTSVSHLLAEAEAQGCSRVILSSEYLSLWRPKAAERLVADLGETGAGVEYVLFSRPVLGWVAALFNQYVKTVDQKAAFANINGFIDQVLANRAIDIARRYRMWEDLVGAEALTHYRIADSRRSGGGTDGDILAAFERFAGCAIPRGRGVHANRSLSPDQLHSIGLLRQRKPSPDRDRAIGRLLDGGAAHSMAPDDYLTITAERLARLRQEIEAPYHALPCTPLPACQRSTAELAPCEAHLVVGVGASESVALKRHFGWARRIAQALPNARGIGAQLQRHPDRPVHTVQTRP